VATAVAFCLRFPAIDPCGAALFACQCAISRQGGERLSVKLTVYKTGAIAHWRVVGGTRSLPFFRGKITDMSKRSRIRAAWAFANAPRDWAAMAVLTFRENPPCPKAALRKFVRKFRLFFGPSYQWAWVMEFQSRGVVHFHIFLERRILKRHAWHVEKLIRRGKEVDLVRGGLEELIVTMWASAVGDDHPDFLRFQRGGIIELLRSPDAAARYVAKEASKRAQKVLPEWLEGAGRWWWLSPAGKPRRQKVITIKRWPYDRPYALIFDTDKTVALQNKPTRAKEFVVTRAPRETDPCYASTAAVTAPSRH
jgi:hypothetical protein